MMMRHFELSLENTRRNETLCVSVAAGLHLLLVAWNPVMLRSGWTPPHDFVTVDVVEEVSPGAPGALEKPMKMSLMDTLKDMLMKPKEEGIAHVAPQVTQPPAAAPQPLLREVARPRAITPSFQPQSQSDEIAGSKNPDSIQTTARNLAPIPAGAPTLQAKSYGGIRAKDLPFQVGGDQSLSGGPDAVPIALGNKSAKGALGYAAPSLQNNQKGRVGIQPALASGKIYGGGDVNGLAAASPAQIALSGTGGSGSAPTGPAAGGALQNRRGGGMVGSALMGSNRGSYVGSGLGGGGLPTAARELDSQISQAGSSGQVAKKVNKGFEIAGPLTNRAINKKVIPQYPAWAEEQGLIGSVRLYFTVTPDGKVRPNITVTKTTGYPQLDQLGIDALKEWQFAPLSAADEGRGEWGIITFNFSLSS